MTRQKRTRIQKALFGLGIIYILGAPLIFLLPINAKEPAIFLLVSGALLTILSRFEDITELGLFGLKAKVERALGEAQVTLEQVKELAKISAISSLSNTARSGWIGGIPDDLQQEILTSTEETLKKLGYTDDEIKEITEDFYNCRLTSYRQTLLAGGSMEIPSGENREAEKEWKDLRKWGIKPMPPEILRAFFTKYIVMTTELEKRLNDYEHYFKTRTLPDLEDYKDQENWPRLTLKS
jgi:hypothetical protein